MHMIIQASVGPRVFYPDSLQVHVGTGMCLLLCQARQGERHVVQHVPVGTCRCRASEEGPGDEAINRWLSTMV